MALTMLSFSSVRGAQADEIMLSEIPIVNLLSQSGALTGQGDVSNDPATVHFVVINDSPQSVSWLFRTEVLNPLAFDFFITGQDAPIFQSTFSARGQKSHASQGPVLKSDLIAMAPGEQLGFRAVFEQPPGAELFPISILSARIDASQTQRRSLIHGLSFGALLTFAILFLLAPNFLMNAASNWFGVYLASMALLNMHAHGYGLEFLNITPDAYFPITRVLQTCVMLFYLLFILAFLKARDAYPVFARSVWAFIVIGTSIAVLEQLLGRTEFQVIANLVPLTFLIFGFCGAYLAVRDRLHGSRFFMGGFAVLLVGGMMNFAASLPDLALWNARIDQLTLLFQTVDALIFGSAILSQMYGLRDARDQAVTVQLQETERRLTLSNELLSTESDLRRTRALAEHHRANLSATSHDLKQPIVSLRTSLEIAQERSPELVSELSAGIEFLDQLLGQTLAKARLEGLADAPPAQHGQEDVELQMILQNVQRMFAPEAAEKGIALRSVGSTLVVQIPTIDLIRIVSNLTSNAVRYTSSGRVLIGVRRRNGKAAIEVWDTGHGIPAEQKETILNPYYRGETPGTAEGEGLGLSIVKQLADRNDLTLTLRSFPGKGSVFALDGLMIRHAPDAKT